MELHETHSKRLSDTPNTLYHARCSTLFVKHFKFITWKCGGIECCAKDAERF